MLKVPLNPSQSIFQSPAFSDPQVSWAPHLPAAKFGPAIMTVCAMSVISKQRPAVMLVLGVLGQTKRLFKKTAVVSFTILISEITNVCYALWLDNHQNQPYGCTTISVCKLDVKFNSGVSAVASLARCGLGPCLHRCGPINALSVIGFVLSYCDSQLTGFEGCLRNRHVQC